MVQETGTSRRRPRRRGDGAPDIGLTAHRKRQLEEKMRLAGLYEDRGLIFATRKDTSVNLEHLVKRYFKPLLNRAGLPEIRSHDLRHTCATLLLGRGVHPKYVQELLRHAIVAMTSTPTATTFLRWEIKLRARWGMRWDRSDNCQKGPRGVLALS